MSIRDAADRNADGRVTGSTPPWPAHPDLHIVQILVCGYAWWRGGQPERVVALLLMAEGLGTLLMPTVPRGFDQLHWRILAIDVALLAPLGGWLALRAARFWTLWLAAMHLIANRGAFRQGLSTVPAALDLCRRGRPARLCDARLLLVGRSATSIAATRRAPTPTVGLTNNRDRREEPHPPGPLAGTPIVPNGRTGCSPRRSRSAPGPRHRC